MSKGQKTYVVYRTYSDRQITNLKMSYSHIIKCLRNSIEANDYNFYNGLITAIFMEIDSYDIPDDKILVFYIKQSNYWEFKMLDQFYVITDVTFMTLEEFENIPNVIKRK